MKNLDSLSNLRGVNIARIATVPFAIVTQLKYQINALRNAGANLYLISGRDDWGSDISKLNANHIYVDIKRDINLFRDILSLLSLWIFFRKNQIHIVHSTTPKAGLLTAIAAKFAGVPIRVHTFTGQVWINKKGFSRLFLRLFDSIIAWLSTECYTDSNSQRKFLIAERVVNKNKIHVLGSGSLAGVDLDQFNPNKFTSLQKKTLRNQLGISESAIIVTFIGRLGYEKGIPELFAACSKLFVKFSNLHLLLVGPIEGGSDQLDINAFSMNDRVHLCGYTEAPENYLSITDIFCLPSHREGFGTVIIEAGAMEIPAVGSRINGLTDAILHNETGLLFDRGSVDSLYEAISYLILNPKVRASLGANAKLRAVELFSSDHICKLQISRYVNLIKSCRVSL